MVQVIEQYDPFGRLGEGLGAGFSKMMGKRVESGMMSKGLQAMQGVEDKTDPIAIMQAGLRAGMTPEQLQNMLPMVMQQLQKQTYLGKDGQPEAAPESDQATSRAQPIEQSPIAQGTPRAEPVSAEDKAFERKYGVDYQTMQNPQMIKDMLKPMPAWTQEQHDARARQYLLSGRTNDVDKAKALALEEENRAKAAWASRQEQILKYQKTEDDYDDAADSAVTNKLQGDKLSSWNDVPGDIQDRMKNKYVMPVVLGKIAGKKAAQQYATEALRFADSRIRLGKIGIGGLFGFGKETPEQLSSLMDRRQVYAENGALDLFVKDLQTKNGLSVGMASLLARPPTEKVQSMLDDLPKIKKAGPKGKQAARDVAVKKKRELLKPRVKEFTENLVDSQAISTNDSIHAIAKSLFDRGLDEKVFYSTLKKAVMDGKLELTASQEDELSQDQSMEPNVGDYILGKEPNVTAGLLWRKFRGR